MSNGFNLPVLAEDDDRKKNFANQAKWFVDAISTETARQVIEGLEARKTQKTLKFGFLYETYMQIHARPHIKTWRNYERMYASYLSTWSNRQATEISRLDVERLLGDLSLAVGETTANRVIEFVRMLFNKAIEWNLVECINPAIGVRMFKLRARDRFLEKAEIQKLFTAIESLRYETTRDFLYMCLFTGARRSNVAAMRWDEVSFDTWIWHIPDTKNGTPQNVPVTPYAKQILEKRFQVRDSEWVFPSKRSPTGHLTKPELAWAAVVKRANLSDTRIHDLRRTLASWEALTGANLSVIAASLNHKDFKSTAIYARLNVGAVRTAMEAATEKMLEAIPKPTFAPSYSNRETDKPVECQPILESAPKDDLKYHYGFGVTESGESVQIPHEIQIIKKIFKMRRQGLSFGGIAAKLNSSGQLRRGKLWAKSSIEWLLKQPKYLSKLDLDDLKPSTALAKLLKPDNNSKFVPVPRGYEY